MKSNVLIFVIMSIFSSYASADVPKVAYGEDNRMEYSDAPADLQLLADSTAGMVDKSDLSDMGNYFSYENSPMSERLFGPWFSNGELCSDERYYNQNMLPNCSGFLVAPNVVVTAGHCITSQEDCNDRSWVFGWDSEAAKTNRISKDNVYNCKKILNRGDDPKDFAVLLLDRNVLGRAPLRYQETTVVKGQEILVIGHPTGLPTKIAPGAQVYSVGSTSFETNLDTFGGNSGSAVFNVDTKEIVGILVNGATDYVEDETDGCFRVNVCDNEPGGQECGGEGVTLISVAELEKYITNVPATNPTDGGNSDTFSPETENLLSYLDEVFDFSIEVQESIAGYIASGANINALNFWGQTPIIQAVDNDNLELFFYLLSLGQIDFARTDIDGRTIKQAISELGNNDFLLALDNEINARFELEKNYLSALESADLTAVEEILKDQRIDINLKKYPFSGDVVSASIKSKNISFINSMEELGLIFSINSTNRYIALEFRDTEMISFLASRGFDLGYGEGDVDLLFLAVMERNVKLVQFLIKNFPEVFDINKEYDSQGSNLLIEAVKSNDLRLIKLILKTSSKETINFVDVNGYTALAYATLNQKLQVARFLLRKGATPFIGGSRETKPYYIARDQNLTVFTNLYTPYGDPTNPELKPGGMSLLDLVELAEPGSTIKVYPGTYTLTRVVITKNLTLLGVGAGVIFEGTNELDSGGVKDATLEISAEEFKIENIKFYQPSLDGVDDDENKNTNGILILSKGVTTLENVRFAGSDIKSTGSGIAMIDDAKLFAKDLKFESMYQGIKVSGNAGVTLSDSEFRNINYGINSYGNSGIKINNIIFNEFRKKAVTSADTAAFGIRNSKFTTPIKSGAISINDKATGIIEDNFFNMPEGWVLWVSYEKQDNSFVTHFNKNTIKNADECLEMGKFARTSIVDNKLVYCRDMGIKASADSYTIIERNEILSEKASAVSLNDNATASIIRNTIKESYHGIYLDGDTTADIYFNTFDMIKNYVLIAKESSSAKFVRNTILDDDTDNYSLGTTGVILNRRTTFRSVN
ncbi:hypothetical protein A9Q84_16355 [Halobacteriovorax marinus]|uniref:Serine protease n=1 Tax=Halobacteriovorax marinus TaxID=97084 RepID=A0A1Y5F4T5_9BACT|nr:hypothetical protein A9Q84_16355 [Halobacteriovorax marinus]